MKPRTSPYIDLVVDELYCLAKGQPTVMTTQEIALSLITWLNNAQWTGTTTGTDHSGMFQFYVDDLSKGDVSGTGQRRVSATERQEKGRQEEGLALQLKNVGDVATMALARADDCDERLMLLPKTIREAHDARFGTFGSRLRWMFTGR